VSEKEFLLKLKSKAYNHKREVGRCGSATYSVKVEHAVKLARTYLHYQVDIWVYFDRKQNA